MAKADFIFKTEEYKYLQDLADTLGIERKILLEIIEEEIPEKKTEVLLERAKQLYRLAIMMLVDGVVAKEEVSLLKDYTIELGFPPETIDVMLERMAQNKGGMLFDDDLIEIFTVQNN
jgi:hypothetical protein